MRKAKKNEILEILMTFPQMHKEIQKAVERDSIDVALQLLQDCQEYAVSLCKIVMEQEKDAAAVTESFKDYCYALVDIVEMLEKKEAGADVSAGSALAKQLNLKSNAIVKCVEKNVPVHKEIVFFPYKASMWDSLESIYLAAKADEKCDVYCVPIPYFDKNPDGSAKEMHYEGQEYPADIEVTDWRKYDFEERKPDVIYIHNPYDELNYVTSVHPRFYAENLKKYTDRLVYVPYFVLEEIRPDDQKKIAGMKHFCVLPGVVYADKVILQSENMAQIYMDEFAKALKTAGVSATKKMLKDKFLGLGSPKLDKVLNTRKEDFI